MSKTIEIKKVHIRNLVISFVLGFGILFCLEHFGQFSYIPVTERSYNEKPSFVSYVRGDADVSSIYYKTFFGETITTSGNGFKVYDVGYQDGEFYDYKNKIYYFTEAFKKDIKYGLYISLGLAFPSK